MRRPVSAQAGGFLSGGALFTLTDADDEPI